jgi:hypothetical protein
MAACSEPQVSIACLKTADQIFVIVSMIQAFSLEGNNALMQIRDRKPYIR